jgi:valyl-tRNA synthetase
MALFTSLAGLGKQDIKITTNVEAPKQAARVVIHGITGYIPLQGIIDLATEVEKLKTELTKIEKMIIKREKKLNSPFATRAPADIIEEERTKLKSAQDHKTQLEEQLKLLS